jgi:hypothetical protein
VVKSQAKVSTAICRKINQSPRVMRKIASSLLVLPCEPARNAPVPARKTKTGAQKCVIQRVRNRATEVLFRSVGLKWALVKKARVWSKAMITMTSPRNTSTETSLPCLSGGRGIGIERGITKKASQQNPEA